MTVQSKLQMTPREAAYVIALTVLRNASAAPNEYLENVYDSRRKALSDGEIQQISAQFAKIHNGLLDDAHTLFGLDGVPI